MTKNKIIERLERETGVPDLVTLLVERLTPTDLQSLLLEVYRQRVGRRQPSAVLADYEDNRFVRPSAVSPLTLLEWDRVAFSQLPPEFRPIELSPVCPLGTCSVIAAVDQNRVLSTIRNTEVVSDSTNVLALECAIRRRQLLRENPKSKTPVHLAASHRLLRTQQFQSGNPNIVPHFSIFTLCSAGQAQGGIEFELSSVALHIDFYLRAIRAFMGEDVPLVLTVMNFGPDERRSLLADRLFLPVREKFANIDCVLDAEGARGRDYYSDLRFHIDMISPSREQLNLADGGPVKWTQALLSNAKERCVTSGIGSERVCMQAR